MTGKLINNRTIKIEIHLRLNVCSCIDGTPNKCQATPADLWNPPLNQLINIHIEQNKDTNGKYYLELRLGCPRN